MKKVFAHSVKFIGNAESRQLNWGLSLNGCAQKPFAGTVDSRKYEDFPPTFEIR